MNGRQSTSISGKHEPENLWFETRRFATLLTMRTASIDLILRSARRARLEGEVVHSGIRLHVSGDPDKLGNEKVNGST